MEGRECCVVVLYEKSDLSELSLIAVRGSKETSGAEGFLERASALQLMFPAL